MEIGALLLHLINFISIELVKYLVFLFLRVTIEAMENWGLLVFKESLVLIDPENYSVQIKAEVALTVSHEIARKLTLRRHNYTSDWFLSKCYSIFKISGLATL